MSELDSDKKVFDIASPSNAKTQIGSKPMIIGHKPINSDPIITNQDNTSEAMEHSEDLDLESKKMRASAKNIEPSEDLKKSIQEESKTQQNSSQTPTEDSNLDLDTKKPRKLSKKALAEKKESELRELIESRKYNLNIKQRHSTKSIKYLISFIIIFSIIFIFVILADADILPFRASLPFDSIK